MNQRDSLVKAAVGILAFCATAINANMVGTGGQLGISRTITAYQMGRGSVKVGAAFNGGFGLDYVEVNGIKENATLLSENVYLAVGLSNFADLSVDLPLYQDIWKNHETNASGIGDLRFGIKLIHPGLKPNVPLRISYVMRTTIPTGEDSVGYFQRNTFTTTRVAGVNNTHPFTSTGWNVNPLLVWTLDMKKFKRAPAPLKLHGNFGANALITTKKALNYQQDNSGLVGQLLLEYEANKKASMFIELSGESRVFEYFDGFTLTDMNNDILIASLGAQIRSQKGADVTFGVDFGISDRSERVNFVRTDDKGAKVAYNTAAVPLIGVNFGLGFGKIGRKADPDFDLVYTLADSCVYDAEDYDNYADADGCPEYDDKRLSVQVMQNDTVVISKTSVVNVHDTVRIDIPSKDRIIDYGIILLRAVQFKLNSSELTWGSNATLDEVAFSLNKYPEVKLEVRGYTDVSGSKEYNIKLSQQRAESVKAYLVKKGVAAGRLEAIGKGPADPITDNSTSDARVLNRRVEIRRFD